jgi:DNA-binding CsgD family transcriptional regulator
MTVEVGRRLVLRADPPIARSSMTGPLVGREPELTALREALRASADDGRSVAIGGDAGSGKTALLAAFLRDVRDSGVIAVEGACVEIESRRPFGAFVDLIASCERAFGSERVGRSLGERGVSLRQLKSLGVTSTGERHGDRYQMHGAILGLFNDLTADDQLAVFLEDLHWADGASLELFGYLARRIRARPLLFVTTYRSDELDRRHPLRPALAELRKARLVDEIALGPLSLEETGDVIRARLRLRDAAPRDLWEFRDLVHARSEGNPLHTEEILDTLRQSGRFTYADGAWTCGVSAIRDAIPASVAAGVVARWAALSPPAQQILLLASVAGHRFDLDLLANVANLSTAELAPLIHEGIDARLLQEETADQPLSFRHALTREALRQQLLHSERVTIHAKIAAALERRQETAPVNPAELAYHFEESGDLAKASLHHEAAARDAGARTDYVSAARSMERSIATASGDIGQGRRQLALVEYLRLIGDDPRAARAAAAALEIGERTDDVRLQGQALLEVWSGSDRNSDPAQERNLLERALVLLEPLGPTAELARAYSWSAGAAARSGDGAAAVAFAERARQTAMVLGLPSELAWATTNVGIGNYVQGRLEESAAAYREAVEIARRAGLVRELYGALMSLRVTLVALGASAEEQRDMQLEVRALTRKHGLGDQGWLSRELIWLHGDGDWDGFLSLMPQVAEPERSDFGVPRLMAMFTSVARMGPQEIGELDNAEKRAAYRASAPSAAWAAQLLLLARCPGEAVEFAASIEEGEVGRRYWGLIPASLVHAVGLFAARECGDEAARERFTRSLLTERPLPVTPNYNRRHVALAQGDIAERDGRIPAALAAYAQALAECERAQYNDNTVMYVMSLIRQRRAELYLRGAAPDLVAAQAEFDALLPYWQKAKATWYLGELSIWADGLGLVFPQAERGSTASVAARQLTRRELEIARLVAQGLTNRQIGTRLTLSVRTAESHIEQIRAKLGFRTRSQIATWVTQRYGVTRSN